MGNVSFWRDKDTLSSLHSLGFIIIQYDQPFYRKNITLFLNFINKNVILRQLLINGTLLCILFSNYELNSIIFLWMRSPLSFWQFLRNTVQKGTTFGNMMTFSRTSTHFSYCCFIFFKQSYKLHLTIHIKIPIKTC